MWCEMQSAGMGTGVSVDVPRIMRQDLYNEACNASKHYDDPCEVRCYYNLMQWKTAGLYGDPEWDVMETCGPCTLPHPDDEDKFVNRWYKGRECIKRDCFRTLRVPETWMRDPASWIRSQEAWDAHYHQ
jgi:hypothetical protein